MGIAVFSHPRGCGSDPHSLHIPPIYRVLCFSPSVQELVIYVGWYLRIDSTFLGQVAGPPLPSVA